METYYEENLLICFFSMREFFLRLVEQSNLCRNLNLYILFTPNIFPNSRIQECEIEVERILYLYQLADRVPDSFNNAANVTKSYIHVVNNPTCLEKPAI